MEKVIKVVLCKVGEAPRMVEIENTLEAKQELVGGWIEMACPPIHDDDAVVICNEEGKLLKLPPNRFLRLANGMPYDVICGDFFIIRAPADSDVFEGLTDEQVEKYIDFYGGEI